MQYFIPSIILYLVYPENILQIVVDNPIKYGMIDVVNNIMIKLEEQFTSGDGGFSTDPLNYKQLKRTETVALYERSRRNHILDYEVFVIKIDPKGKVNKFPGGVIKVNPDDKEKYPSSGQWGKIAWSCSNLTRANERFDELVKNANLAMEEPTDEVEFIIPTEEFTTAEFANKNEIMYPIAALFIKANVELGKIKFLREERRNAKGKASKIYIKA